MPIPTPYAGHEKPFWVMMEAAAYPGDLRFYSSHDTREEAEALAADKNEKQKAEPVEADRSKYRYSVIEGLPKFGERIEF